MFSVKASLWFVFCPVISSMAGPNPLHQRRATPDNTVIVNGVDNYCLVFPRDQHTNVGDSEYPGGMTVYCSDAAHTSPLQGTIPPGFWTNVAYSQGVGSGRYAQRQDLFLSLSTRLNSLTSFLTVTGCINPSLVDRLNPADFGGQYDSSGGPNGAGNPAGSVCVGYNHYVELLEPAGPRACIRCCDDPADCPTKLGMSFFKIPFLGSLPSQFVDQAR
ncbi:hypothetical protein D9619_010237 [Psilocybe cf. subviscida]|uniref:Uncharacterized protein n=1 Tax=Psilocybe cf. subviscida TaxID=2480587 RepID=A0A8H5ASN1_9AGAR|nr:hypothetical protein D9619_010237 [Psilocybe cf. subviscida]